MASGAEDPLLSRPVFDSRRETVMIPMRDGVRLATDLYFPVPQASAWAAAAKAPEKLPVILIRTPYKKDMSEIIGVYYARRGYAAAVQDCRG
ncbi:MAG: hypothetical protein MUP19_03855, partial [Candidatus Aminicenantes bacterium]|nr:hypothetical protein [Candidatus Aminicenantes bacterium]